MLVLLWRTDIFITNTPNCSDAVRILVELYPQNSYRLVNWTPDSAFVAIALAIPSTINLSNNLISVYCDITMFNHKVKYDFRIIDNLNCPVWRKVERTSVRVIVLNSVI